MTKEEVAVVFDMIKSYYPKSGLNRDNAMQLVWWTKALKDLDFKFMDVVMQKIVAVEKYEPSVATIRDYYFEACKGNLVDAEVGWGQVKKAIRYYGYARGKEALESLPEEVSNAVIAMGGWQSICEAPFEQETNMRAQFRQCLQTINRRESEDRRIDNNVSLMISNVQAQNKLQIEEKKETDTLVSTERSRNVDDFKSVEEVLVNLGLRKEVIT